ncbi:WYL domain-containing protein [Cohnella luojiensis]|uniref:WYL domain-containing protein n=1 Tax=Cohnella luojiensis TaxID=652876 RepID=A0A4Y8LNQ3_9BACL|nr:WYL domain-containing protein [Cohnella luojiensis]TFE19844.1 WYL domain-containing protein [Cohnella luojiensis]
MKIEDSTTSDEDGGWVNASVEFHTLESACEILLGYGRHAREISPAELNQAIREECLAVTALYENS